ncbi:hypothetical protein C8R43DRAFT_1186357 [Mycena crocata]|nr:hypothetical protein C8R43DRAFT_1186357 [Mycena crocata]
MLLLAVTSCLFLWSAYGRPLVEPAVKSSTVWHTPTLVHSKTSLPPHTATSKSPHVTTRHTDWSHSTTRTMSVSRHSSHQSSTITTLRSNTPSGSQSSKGTANATLAHSSSPSLPSVTSIEFNSNPVAPSGATVETILGPSTTTTMDIPSATTVITLGPPTFISVGSFRSTFISGSQTVVETVVSTTIEAAQLTLGPGGGVVGSAPTSLSQIGFIPPVFSPRYQSLTTTWSYRVVEFDFIDHGGTFTGQSGYSTVVPMPTASSEFSTVVIAGIFGGGSIVVGAGGSIVGPVPPGIAEVGGLNPVPIPPPGADSPEERTTTAEPSTGSTAASSSSASPSSSKSGKCPEPTVTVCGSICASDDPNDAADDNNDDSIESDRRRLSLRSGTVQKEKRSDARRKYCRGWEGLRSALQATMKGHSGGFIPPHMDSSTGWMNPPCVTSRSPGFIHRPWGGFIHAALAQPDFGFLGPVRCPFGASCWVFSQRSLLCPCYHLS